MWNPKYWIKSDSDHSSNNRVMDHENNAPSLLKLIEDYDPIFLNRWSVQRRFLC
ncbi:hypothetical protein HanPI659440_Chr17g0688721 [Helianthus annuus]|nr:hypothetical protein HanPI659440_Chr17g0688721 [Helianthus annuus]